jgi:hypothetical protein
MPDPQSDFCNASESIIWLAANIAGGYCAGENSLAASWR